jgi:hypothetical protein
MSGNASEFVQILSKNEQTVGFVPGRALSEVLQVWGSVHAGKEILRVRLPYQPGRKDRQLASVLLQALGRPALTQGISTVRAWEMIADRCQDCNYSLVVIENADLLDRHSLTYLTRNYLPAAILVGGERLAQRIAQNGAYQERIHGWASF